MKSIQLDFNRGIDKRRLHSSQGSVSDASNLIFRNGVAQTVKSNLRKAKYPFGMWYYVAQQYHTTLLSSLLFVGTQTVAKTRGTLWRVVDIPISTGSPPVAGTRVCYLPLWERSNVYGQDFPVKEQSTSFGDDVYFSIVQHGQKHQFGRDRCLMWKGDSFIAKITRDNTYESETLDRWTCAIVSVAPEHDATTTRPLNAYEVLTTDTSLNNSPTHNQWLHYGEMYPTAPTDEIGFGWWGRVRLRGWEKTGSDIWLYTDKVSGTWPATLPPGKTSADIVVGCLVSIDPIGIRPPSQPPTVTITSGGNITNGTYKFISRYVSSSRGWAGNPSEPTQPVTISNETGHTLQFDQATFYQDEIPWWADRIEIYWSKVGQNGEYGGYWLCSEIAMAATQNDIRWFNVHSKTLNADVEGDPLPVDAYWKTAPPVLAHVRTYAGRLYGVDFTDTSKNLLRFSTMNEPHSWPMGIADATNYEDLQYVGGSQRVGSPTEILGLIVEGSSYQSTGIQGENLLIIKRHRSYRWYGQDWSDFRLSDGMMFGSLNNGSIQNVGGMVLMVGLQGILAISPGAAKPEILSEAIWPNGPPGGMNEATLYTEWSSGVWKGYYVFSRYVSVQDNECWMLDLSDGSFSRHGTARILAASHNDDIHTLDWGGDIYRWFAGDTCAAWELITALFPLMDDPWSLNKRKHIRRIGLATVGGNGDQIKVQLIPNEARNDSTNWSKTITLPASATWHGATVSLADATELVGNIGRVFAVRLSCASPSSSVVDIQSVAVDYEPKREDGVV